MRRPQFLVILLVSLFAFSAAAESGLWGQRGISRAFVTRGDILYAADGRGVAVYDVSRGNEIGRIDLEWGEDETADLALLGTTELVVATSGGVERFSIASNGMLDRLGATTKTGPVSHIAANAQYAAAASDRTVTLLERNASGGLDVRSRIHYGAPVTALAFVGAHLYVAAEREPVRVYLAPSTTTLDRISSLQVRQFAVSGNTLWAVSEDDGLIAIDVTSPAAPEVVGSTARFELRLSGVAAAGDRVYAFELPNRVHAFDVSDRTRPTRIATMTEWVNVIGAEGTRLFLSGLIVDDSGLAYDPGLIRRATGTPLRMFDATNPAQPVLAAEYRELAGPVSGVWTDGSVAYVVDPPYLRVLDVSKTASPREVTSILVPDIQDRIRVKNGIAVLYGRALVNILDVSSPLRPRVIATWDAQGHAPSAAGLLRTRFVEANNHSGMHVVDFGNATAPVQIGGRIWHYHDMASSDDAVYALQQDSMLVVEIAGERTVVDQADLPLIADQVDTAPANAARPDHLLLRGEFGLTLYSLSEDRFHPVVIGSLAVPDLGTFGTGPGTAWVTKGGRLYFVDLTRELTLAPTDMRVTSPMQISVAGEKIVIADRYWVRIYGPDTPPPAPVKRRSSRH